MEVWQVKLFHLDHVVDHKKGRVKNFFIIFISYYYKMTDISTLRSLVSRPENTISIFKNRLNSTENIKENLDGDKDIDNSGDGKLPDEKKVHPLAIVSEWGKEDAWKLISKTINGAVTTIVLAFDISQVGCLVQIQSLNAEGQVYAVTTEFVKDCRTEARTNEGLLSRYDLVQMHGNISLNG